MERLAREEKRAGQSQYIPRLITLPDPIVPSVNESIGTLYEFCLVVRRILDESHRDCALLWNTLRLKTTSNKAQIYPFSFARLKVPKAIYVKIFIAVAKPNFIPCSVFTASA